MSHTIKISDGSTTVDLLGSNYKILNDGGWSPRRAQRIRGGLGGRSRYGDVVETMYISIAGTSGSDCLDKLDTLSNLLDQAEAWGQGENVTAVYLEYEPPASALANSVKAVITGPPAFGEYFDMPRKFGGVQLANNYVIGEAFDPIVLSFTRRGLWLGATETETSSASTGNPVIRTSSTFTDTAAILWPYDAYLQFSAVPSFPGGGFYVAFVNDTDKVLMLEAESNIGTNMTSTAVTGSSAGNVARIDTSTTTASLSYVTSTALDASVKAVRVFAMVRNNSTAGSSDIDYTLQARYLTLSYGRAVVVDTSSQDPQLIDLGVVTTPDTFRWSTSAIYVDITADKSVTSSNQLDVDYLIVVAEDDSTSILYLDAGTPAAYWNVEHRLDSHISPLCYIASTAFGTITDASTYDGNAVLAASGNAITAVIFGPSDGDFTIQDSSNNELNVTLGVKRTLAYLTPV